VVAEDSAERRSVAALEELFDHAERVRLVDWSTVSGAKSTILLLGGIAVISFVTGLSHLSAGTVSLDGPLGDLVSGSSGLIRLYGVFFAFLFSGLTLGLARRVRIAWYATLIALPLIAVLPLVTAAATDLPLLLATIVALPLAIKNRTHFDQAVDLSPFQTGALAAFIGAQLYGTVGAFALRDEFVGVETLTDAFYYIIVTGTTVGYGDATPTSQLTKLFALSVIVLGTGTFTVASGSLLIPAIESRISSAFGNMSASELSVLEDHVLVLGYGDITEPLLDELDAEDVVVVTEDTEKASELRETDVNVLTADPTDAASLRDARIERAGGVVVATEDDARDVLAVLAARQANADIRVVAAATDRNHVDKLDGVGADRVVSPTIIGGRLLGRSVLDEDATLDVAEADSNATEESEEAS
jgi:voltage-gated potassium channel